MLVKNVRPWPLDTGGRIFAAGETGDVDPSNPAVADLLGRGDLLAVQVVGESGPELMDLPRGAGVVRVPKQSTPSKES